MSTGSVEKATADLESYRHRVKGLTMKIRVLRNLGKGLPPYTEGQEVDAPNEEAAMLIEQGLAEPLEPIKTVAKPATVRGEDSPVADEAAAQAIDEITRMRDRKKLQHIADNDQRVTVQAAARKRLREI